MFRGMGFDNLPAMRHVRIPPVLLLIFVIGLLAGACIYGYSPERSTIMENEARWNSLAPENYEFDYRRICFCPPEYTAQVVIEVRDRKVWTVEYKLSEMHLDPPDTTGYPTIPDLFELLIKAEGRGAAKMRMAFDDIFGFPMDVDIDYDKAIIDEEFGFTVSSFVRK